MQLKMCNGCKTEKRIIDFALAGMRYGKVRRKPTCKSCHNLARRRTPIIRSTKEGFKICIKCVVEKPLSSFHLQRNGLFGVRGRCSECEAPVREKYRDDNRDTLRKKDRDKYHSMPQKEKNDYINKKSIQNMARPDIIEKRKAYQSSDKGIFHRYRSDASRRTYSFELTFTEFSKLINANCFYCGKERCKGVDRADNKIGYNVENCLPCCKVCNEIKMSRSVEEMYDHLKKMSSHYKKNKKEILERFK